MNTKLKIKDKITPKMLKTLETIPSSEQDYGVLYLFTDNEFEDYESCKAYWEETDIADFTKAMKTVMAKMQPKPDALNSLNDKLQAD